MYLCLARAQGRTSNDSACAVLCGVLVPFARCASALFAGMQVFCSPSRGLLWLHWVDSCGDIGELVEARQGMYWIRLRDGTLKSIPFEDVDRVLKAEDVAPTKPAETNDDRAAVGGGFDVGRSAPRSLPGTRTGGWPRARGSRLMLGNTWRST